jgi:mRNA-degrading endonuclease toxin of MazEF toxin-antitoxin module
VIVSNDVNNQHSPVVIVASITSKTASRRYPQNVRLTAGNPLPEGGEILGGQLTTIDKARLDGFRASLSPSQIVELDAALRVSLAV